ncbi:histidinol dehydrogenase [Desulfohalotomaculum tongense]|uniref:histidinol dehydrogenase n=1 Tax=Desulforadius tongensis TaxID=1216062 RepID=UPI00195959DE|nr:histidinol dehydrogenase [Desulforadius tongensis]MBM7854263.1 histidinol dehydrogenase [Desulforadius tongensis]
MIKILKSGDLALSGFLYRRETDKKEIAQSVAQIIDTVVREGDRALIHFTEQFDKVKLTPGQLKVTAEEINEAYNLVDGPVLESLKLARDRIEAFHRRQRADSWFEPDAEGTVMGQMVRPLFRVGIYVPGGTASYPSSVLMNAVPAKVAGVKEVVMVTPPGKDGKINPYTLVAAREAGVTEIYKVGGAQAVAALAYGTQTISPVDKITGPGNIYVTLAKQQVYGKVDIDMLAGPSEVLVIADSNANPAYAAADLLSQAEHDPLAAAVLLTPDEKLARQVQDELIKQVKKLPRQNVAKRSLGDYGTIVITRDLDEAFKIANRFAPEHLELLVDDPFTWLGKVQNAGSIFLGPYAPEPVGDYLAGPNHILPTGGTAKFYSGLNVDTFIKKSTVIFFSQATLQRLGEHVIRLAEIEGLEAHANAVRMRVKKWEENK